MADIIMKLEDIYFTRGGEHIREAIREIEKRDVELAALRAKVMILEARLARKENED